MTSANDAIPDAIDVATAAMTDQIAATSDALLEASGSDDVSDPHYRRRT